MNTTTFEHRALRVSDLLAALAHQPLQFLSDLFTPPAPTLAQSAQQLRDLAETYESTQPSYAADLRAAAARY